MVNFSQIEHNLEKALMKLAVKELKPFT